MVPRPHEGLGERFVHAKPLIVRRETFSRPSVLSCMATARLPPGYSNCPQMDQLNATTSKEVRTGIDTDPAALAKMRNLKVAVNCPHCVGGHIVTADSMFFSFDLQASPNPR